MPQQKAFKLSSNRKTSNQSPASDLDEERSTVSSSTPDMAEEDDAIPAKRKNRFGLLPTQKNKRVKVTGSGVPKHLFTPEQD
jgi:hypothetical protein